MTHDGNKWEIDVFKGTNKGLTVAEFDLTSIDQNITVPQWIKEEVTGHNQYRNSRLAYHPFKIWEK